MQTRSITRRFRTTACAGSLLLAGLTVALDAARVPAPTRPAAAPAATVEWREAPEYVALLAPRVYRDAYRAFVAATGLEPALRLVAAESASLQAPGSWMAHPESLLEAFGNGGTYDRGKISRLYGSRRPMVARGPRGGSGIVEESWTLISPYPSADLERLEPGTLLLVLRVP